MSQQSPYGQEPNPWQRPSAAPEANVFAAPPMAPASDPTWVPVPDTTGAGEPPVRRLGMSIVGAFVVFALGTGFGWVLAKQNSGAPTVMAPGIQPAGPDDSSASTTPSKLPTSTSVVATTTSDATVVPTEPAPAETTVPTTDPGFTTTLPGTSELPDISAWQPSVIEPDSSQYVIIESDPGDYIGQGQNMIFTQENSSITLTSSGPPLLDNRWGATFGINGDTFWTIDVKMPQDLWPLEVGTVYPASRAAFSNPRYAGVDFSGDGRGCNESVGTVIIDEIVPAADGVNLDSLVIRFEQACEGYSGPLARGKLVWKQTGAERALRGARAFAEHAAALAGPGRIDSVMTANGAMSAAAVPATWEDTDADGFVDGGRVTVTNGNDAACVQFTSDTSAISERFTISPGAC